jgi:hypothetical protein
MEKTQRLTKAQTRKLLEYLEQFEKTMYTPITHFRYSERKRKNSEKVYRNVRTALAIVKYYANPETTLDQKPSFRKTKVHDLV